MSSFDPVGSAASVSGSTDHLIMHINTCTVMLIKIYTITQRLIDTIIKVVTKRPIDTVIAVVTKRLIDTIIAVVTKRLIDTIIKATVIISRNIMMSTTIIVRVMQITIAIMAIEVDIAVK